MKIICGDCVEKMSEMEEGSIQLVVTSPPYDNLRTYKGFSWDFEAVAKQICRVLCEGGICCWNVGDSVVEGSETLTSFKQAIYFKEQCRFRVHDTMIYEKSNFAHPDRTRYHQLFEHIFVLSKGAPRVFNPINDKRNAYAGTGSLGTNTMRERDGSSKVRPRNIISEFGKRGNVWRGNTAGQESPCGDFPHPAMMPKWLARDLIISWSNEGDTVLDPFAGSFTTCIEAEQIGRKAIGIDISEEYCELGRKAIIKPQQFEFLPNGAQQ